MVGIVSLLILPISQPALAGTFTLVGTHPDAINQATARGRTLVTLKPFSGKIYAGYGDYGSNTGPIGVRSFDPATNTFSSQLLNSSTEALYIYRELNSKLYGPHQDPCGSGNGGYAVGTTGETWTDQAPVSAYHIFDMNTHTGTDLWMVGSHSYGGNDDGAVWHSTDNGASWQVSLSLQAVVGSSTRIYGIGAYNGKLYVQGYDLSGGWDGRQPNSKVYDGTSWSDGPDLMPDGGLFTWHPESFAGHMVYQLYHAGVEGMCSPLYKFDGTSATRATTDYLYDFTISDGVLYALTEDGTVMYTTDLVNWTDFCTAPGTGRSLAVLDRELFIGGTEAQLFKFSEPVPEPATLAILALGGLSLICKRRTCLPS